jgi:5-methylcytosine-specific restriction endonuclease McrA
MDCPMCDKSLQSERGMRQHHTKVHGEPLPNRTCKGCETEFYDPKARRKFCDDCNPNAGEHNGNWKGKRKEMTCKRCDEMFEFYPSDKKGVYCPECVEASSEFLGEPYYEVHEIERTKKVCEFCGRIIDVLQSRADRYPVRFCSHNCLSLSLMMRDASDQNVYNGNWREVRRRTLDRDDHRCKNCGATEEELGQEPDVHHIVPVREFSDPQIAHSIDNLICLCRSCHRLAEIGAVDIPTGNSNS